MLRAYLLAVLVQLIAVNSLAELGFIHASVLPFFGILTALGGLIFGLGMTLAVGCIGAVFMRAGEGKLDYIFAALAFALGAWVSNDWLVAPLRALVGESLLLSLYRALDLDRWVVIATIIVAALLWLIRGKREIPHHGWTWTRTGFFLGLVGASAWITSALTGRPYGLGTVQGVDSIATFFLQADWNALNWNAFVVAGIPLGSFIAARVHGIPARRDFLIARLPQAIAGGLLMGIGAAIAAGDNVLHGLSGIPTLAIASLTFIVCMFLGAWLGIRLGWLR
ncbi:MAG: YeeE/YedE family protein [Chloroflexi bacterium]|nr:YeeE/YedE family protein [Chloroflexota bacterium]